MVRNLLVSSLGLRLVLVAKAEVAVVGMGHILVSVAYKEVLGLVVWVVVVVGLEQGLVGLGLYHLGRSLVHNLRRLHLVPTVVWLLALQSAFQPVFLLHEPYFFQSAEDSTLLIQM